MDVSFKTMCFVKNRKASKRDLGNLETFELVLDLGNLETFELVLELKESLSFRS